MKTLRLSNQVPRAEVIEMVVSIAEKAAKKFGYTEACIGENRQKGIRGEQMTRYLEREYGECTKEVKWKIPGEEKGYIEFRFRFATPCVCIRTPEGNLAELEINNHEDTDWKIEQITVFNEGGIELMKYLIRLWNNAVRKKEVELSNGIQKEV